MAKCADCQFLALPNRFTGRLDLAAEEYRSTGEAPYFRRRGGQLAPFRDQFEYPYSNVPACYIGARDLGAFEGRGDPQAVLTYLNTDRDCPPFVSCRPAPGKRPEDPSHMAWLIAWHIKDAVLGGERS